MTFRMKVYIPKLHSYSSNYAWPLDRLPKHEIQKLKEEKNLHFITLENKCIGIFVFYNRVQR